MVTSWAVPFLVLAIGGGVVALSLLLRHLASAPRRLKKPLPSDPGFPVAPLGPPYRGPQG